MIEIMTYPVLMYDFLGTHPYLEVLDCHFTNSNYLCQEDIIHMKEDLLTISPHWHLEYQILYVKQGSICLFREGVQKNYPAGSIIVIDPCDIHGFKIQELSQSIVLKLVISHKYIVSNYPEIHLHAFNIPTRSKQTEIQTEYYHHLLRYFDMLIGIDLESDPDPLSRIEANIIIERVFFVLVKYFSSIHEENPARVKVDVNAPTYWKEAVYYINSHYEEHIKLEDIAKSITLSASYLSKHFKEATGLTVMEYLKKVRLMHALDELKQKYLTHLSIEEIAIRNGFYDTKALNRMLKKNFGVTASYIRSHPKQLFLEGVSA